MWLAWDGEDVLTVDIFADGDSDCVFRWRTSGIQVDEPCTGCDFDFDVVAEFDSSHSTCTGAASRLERRWWAAERLYFDPYNFDESSLVDGTLSARSYRLELDDTYGAMVATTLQVAAELR